MTFQPDPLEPEGPRSPAEEAEIRRQALAVGEELERRGMGWVLGPVAGRLEGDAHALYHVRDAEGRVLSFPTVEAIDEWLRGE